MLIFFFNANLRTTLVWSPLHGREDIRPNLCFGSGDRPQLRMPSNAEHLGYPTAIRSVISKTRSELDEDRIGHDTVELRRSRTQEVLDFVRQSVPLFLNPHDGIGKPTIQSSLSVVVRGIASGTRQQLGNLDRVCGMMLMGRLVRKGSGLKPDDSAFWTELFSLRKTGPGVEQSHDPTEFLLPYNILRTIAQANVSARVDLQPLLWNFSDIFRGHPEILKSEQRLRGYTLEECGALILPPKAKMPAPHPKPLSAPSLHAKPTGAKGTCDTSSLVVMINRAKKTDDAAVRVENVIGNVTRSRVTRGSKRLLDNPQPNAALSGGRVTRSSIRYVENAGAMALDDDDDALDDSSDGSADESDTDDEPAPGSVGSKETFSKAPSSSAAHHFRNIEKSIMNKRAAVVTACVSKKSMPQSDAVRFHGTCAISSVPPHSVCPCPKDKPLSVVPHKGDKLGVGGMRLNPMATSHQTACDAVVSDKVVSSEQAAMPHSTVPEPPLTGRALLYARNAQRLNRKSTAVPDSLAASPSAERFRDSISIWRGFPPNLKVSHAAKDTVSSPEPSAGQSPPAGYQPVALETRTDEDSAVGGTLPMLVGCEGAGDVLVPDKVILSGQETVPQSEVSEIPLTGRALLNFRNIDRLSRRSAPVSNSLGVPCAVKGIASVMEPEAGKSASGESPPGEPETRTGEPRAGTKEDVKVRRERLKCLLCSRKLAKCQSTEHEGKPYCNGLCHALVLGQPDNKDGIWPVARVTYSVPAESELPSSVMQPPSVPVKREQEDSVLNGSLILPDSRASSVLEGGQVQRSDQVQAVEETVQPVQPEAKGAEDYHGVKDGIFGPAAAMAVPFSDNSATRTAAAAFERDPRDRLGSGFPGSSLVPEPSEHEGLVAKLQDNARKARKTAIDSNTKGDPAAAVEVLENCIVGLECSRVSQDERILHSIRSLEDLIGDFTAIIKANQEKNHRPLNASRSRNRGVERDRRSRSRSDERSHSGNLERSSGGRGASRDSDQL